MCWRLFICCYWPGGNLFKPRQPLDLLNRRKTLEDAKHVNVLSVWLSRELFDWLPIDATQHNKSWVTFWPGGKLSWSISCRIIGCKWITVTKFGGESKFNLAAGAGGRLVAAVVSSDASIDWWNQTLWLAQRLLQLSVCHRETVRMQLGT